MEKLYLYPPDIPNNRGVVKNPYIANFRNSLSNYFCIVNSKMPPKLSILDFCKSIFKINVVIFNWIEDIGNRKMGLIQFFLFLISFLILKIRRVKIVWVLHNIHPHNGETLISKFVKKIMFNSANLVLTHSNEAQIYAKKYAKNKVVFLHHPISEIIINNNKSVIIQKDIYDILIWGSIVPYKGVLEFLEDNIKRKNNYKIKVVGSCKDSIYESKLKSNCTDNVEFENRKISFEELKVLVENTKYTIFPYKSSSVSSSGALFDTLYFRGNVIGPNKGAFKDLSKKDICFVFNNYDDIYRIIENNQLVDQKELEKFINANTWGSLCEFLYNNVKNKKENER